MQEISVTSLDQWISWLDEQHDRQESIWLVLGKKDSSIPYIPLDEIIDTALCYGWVDSLPNKLDNEKYKLRFSPRNPKSNWSKVNKDKVERLMAEGKMRAPGLKMVELAKKRGTWNALDEVEKLIIPDDLAVALSKYERALENFKNFPKSVKRGILEWIFNAKRPDTREKRIRETAEKAAENIRANQYNRA